ncbi:MAG: adenylosuccinate lyase [Candidatus Omnitrophica bacterium]|nr:adenylosuccinate lyase [Candidatus Omnitrophota bacterium]
MIARYTLPRMGGIWSEENKLSIWLKIEVYACEALTQAGVIPRRDLAIIRRKAVVSPKRMLKLEAHLNHDVIAFLTALSEKIGPSGRYLHFGLTSSDILDTTLALQMVESADVLKEDLELLLKVLRLRARRHMLTYMAGRTHGMHAEPVTLGLKFLVFHEEVKRGLERLGAVRGRIRVGKLSGAVGTYSQVSPSVERRVLSRLGLVPAHASTQIIQRDRHAEFLTVLAIIGSTLEKIATEIRNLQRSELGEVEEPFGSGQKGSSAMPHKRNPILCERIAGLARVLRANALAGLENISLWHERDITHSSVERIILPDSSILLDYMTQKLVGVLEGLSVYPGRMRANLRANGGLIFSQAVLLALVRAGMSREEAYRIVQFQAQRVCAEDIPFQDALLSDRKVSRLLGRKGVERLCRLDSYGKNIKRIFKRCGVT